MSYFLDSTSVVINVRTGSTENVSEFCKAKLISSMNTFVQIAKKIIQLTLQI